MQPKVKGANKGIDSLGIKIGSIETSIESIDTKMKVIDRNYGAPLNIVDHLQLAFSKGYVQLLLILFVLIIGFIASVLVMMKARNIRLKEKVEELVDMIGTLEKENQKLKVVENGFNLQLNKFVEIENNLEQKVTKLGGEAARLVTKIDVLGQTAFRIESAGNGFNAVADSLDQELSKLVETKGEWALEVSNLADESNRLTDKAAAFSDATCRFETGVELLNVEVTEFKKERKSRIVNLWGCFEYVDDDGNVCRKDIYNKESGDKIDFEEINISIKAIVELQSERKIRLLPPEGVRVSYWERDYTNGVEHDKESDNQYIDVKTAMIKLVHTTMREGSAESVTKYHKVKFHFINHIATLFKNSVTANGQLKGRTAVIANIMNIITNKEKNSSVLICGMRHCGKTSVVNHLHHLLSSNNYNKDWLLLRLDYQLWQQNVGSSFAVFASQFAELTSVLNGGSNKQVIFFIDDYDLIYDKWHKQFDDLFRKFQDRNKKIRFVLSGQRSTSYFESTKHLCSFPQDIVNIVIRGFENDEVDASSEQQSTSFINGLLDGAGLDRTCISGKEKKNIVRFASHYPYFIMAILLEYLRGVYENGESFSLRELSPEFIEREKKKAVSQVRFGHQAVREASTVVVTLETILNKVAEFKGKVSQKTLIDSVVVVNEIDIKNRLVQEFEEGINVLADMGFLEITKEKIVKGAPHMFFYKGERLIGSKVPVEDLLMEC